MSGGVWWDNLGTMQTNVTIRYTGPALDAGRMDVYEASANMLAFSEFMVAAVKTTYGDAAEARADVSGFAHGSFVTSLVFQVGGQAATIFSGLSAGHLWEVVKGAFDLWKHLKGQPPAAVSHTGQACTVTNNSGQVIQVRTDSLNLVFNEKSSEAVGRFVRAALGNDGYEGVEINADSGATIASATREQAHCFANVGKQGVLSDNTLRMIVHVVAPVFQDGNKWRLSDGERSFNAAMLDGDFLMLVNQGARFGKGDVLDVDMRVIQHASGIKTSSERSILKVHRHLSPQEQSALF